MNFAAGTGRVNVDLIFSGLPRIPDPGEELFSKGFSLQMGGGAPATLLNLAGLGVPVRIQTDLGTDMFSEFARRTFCENGVAPINLYRGAGIPLNITTAMLTPGERTFVSYAEDAETHDPEEVYESLRGAKVVAMGLGYLDVYRALKEDGAILVLDTGWDDTMSLETYHESLALADYYTPNQKEACKITGAPDPREAARVLEAYFDRVIVKLDKDGCLIRENGRERVIPGLPVEFVDATGAGDAFLAGLMYGLYHEYSFAESILFGNITGGKCVSAVGCLAARCDEKELLALAAQHRSLLEE